MSCCNKKLSQDQHYCWWPLCWHPRWVDVLASLKFCKWGCYCQSEHCQSNTVAAKPLSVLTWARLRFIAYESNICMRGMWTCVLFKRNQSRSTLFRITQFRQHNKLSCGLSYQIKSIAIHRLVSFCLLGMNFLFALVLIWPCKHKMGNEGFVEKHWSPQRPDSNLFFFFIWGNVIVQMEVIFQLYRVRPHRHGSNMESA